MGLIQNAISALGNTVGGVLADQWLEFFYCDAMDSDTLVVKGKKQVSSRSYNNGNDNIISNGSGIAVADGQCMIIVEQGKIVEVCAQPGQYTYDKSTEPSVFAGKLGQSIIDTFKQFWGRVTHGGDTGKDQRVYYINTKEIMQNPFGTNNPIPFRVVDRNIGLDIDVTIRCNGYYSYRIANPLLFYTNVCGNVTQDYTRDIIDPTLKTEFISALQPAFAKISELEIRPNAVPGHVDQLCAAMNTALSQKWLQLRGIEVVSISMNPITLPEEDAALIKEAQRLAMMRNPGMAAATLVEAQAEALKTAAANEGGAMVGFMGMNMAQQAGGLNAQGLFQMDAQNQQATQQSQPIPAVQPQSAPTADTWKCVCGVENSGSFCTDCGKAKPAIGWTCTCGQLNKGKFCSACGQKKPAAALLYRCDKCGWEPADPTKPPKFCPDCGDPFDSNDTQ